MSEIRERTQDVDQFMEAHTKCRPLETTLAGINPGLQNNTTRVRSRLESISIDGGANLAQIDGVQVGTPDIPPQHYAADHMAVSRAWGQQWGSGQANSCY